MEAIQHFLHSLHGEELRELISAGGLALLFLIVFAETGLLVGFFLPGDSLLFTAGTLVGAGILRAPSPFPQDPVSGFVVLNLTLMAAAIIGDTVGYWFGRKTGPRLFNRPDSRFFKRSHLVKTQEFYERHGGKTIIIARWMPFARTFAPIIAGVAEMPYGRFMTYNIVGGISWVLSCTLLGFLLGNIAWVREHNEKIIMLIIAASLAPAAIHVFREKLRGRSGETARHGETPTAAAAEPAREAGAGADPQEFSGLQPQPDQGGGG